MRRTSSFQTPGAYNRLFGNKNPRYCRTDFSEIYQIIEAFQGVRELKYERKLEELLERAGRETIMREGIPTDYKKIEGLTETILCYEKNKKIQLRMYGATSATGPAVNIIPMNGQIISPDEVKSVIGTGSCSPYEVVHIGEDSSATIRINCGKEYALTANIWYSERDYNASNLWIRLPELAVS